MKAILTTIFLFLAFIVSGQSLSLPELIKMNDMAVDDFDTYATNKGFRFLKTNKDDNSESTSYSYSKNGYRIAFITKTLIRMTPVLDVKTKFDMVVFQTNDEEIYIKFKNEAKKNGFKFVRQYTNNDGTMFMEYSNGSVEFKMTSKADPEGKGNNVVHEISITKSME